MSNDDLGSSQSSLDRLNAVVFNELQRIQSGNGSYDATGTPPVTSVDEMITLYKKEEIADALRFMDQAGDFITGIWLAGIIAQRRGARRRTICEIMDISRRGRATSDDGVLED